MEIMIRLALALVFSGLIGFEREVSESNAGLKTHIIVGIGATIVALIQMEIVNRVVAFAQVNPEISGVVRADASRLIAQVISGIGFLGAGTIIVTKRNISGLTTAASIWTVAIIGIALGMGFYDIAIAGFIFVLTTLFVFKRLIKVYVPERLVIKYLREGNTLEKIEKTFAEMGIVADPARYGTEMFGDQLIHTLVFKIQGRKDFDFEVFISKMSQTKNIISVEKTNIEN